MQRFVLCLSSQTLCHRSHYAQRNAMRLYASKPSHGFRGMNPIGAKGSQRPTTPAVPSLNSLIASNPLLYKLQVRLNATTTRWMRYPFVRWIGKHAMSLATYQCTLSMSCTAVLGLLLYTEWTSATAIEAALERYRCPFRDWIDWKDAIHTEPIQVGPRTLNPQKLTAVHTAYNITNGLFPFQLVFLVLTYPLLLRGWAWWGARRAGQTVIMSTKATPAARSTRPAKPFVRPMQQRSL